MSTLTLAMRDSRTMLRRNLLRWRRYPAMTLQLAGLPVVFLLLFVYVFGGTLGAGLGGTSGGRAEYVNYVVPGILLMAIGGAVTGTAVSVAMDMTEGIISRFRTMAISRASVLTGHVVGSVAQTMVILFIVIAVGLLIGFRPTTSVPAWIALVGFLVLVSFALTWLCVAFGLVAKNAEAASNLPMPLTLLPFFGSGFVPTDSLPTGLRQFAEYQPFTPIIETVRALLTGASVGSTGAVAVAWCVGIALLGYVWAKKLFNRDPAAS